MDRMIGMGESCSSSYPVDMVRRGGGLTDGLRFVVHHFGQVGEGGADGVF